MNIKSILVAAKQRLLYLVGVTPEQLWNRQLDRLIRDVEPDHQKQFRVLIDNFHHSALQSHGSISSGDDSGMDASLIGIQLKALQRMRSFNLVGFQPMHEPVGTVLNLQWIEDENSPPVKLLSVVSGVVEAGIRPLQMKWSVEAITDVKQVHGIDIKSEIEYASACDLALECDSAVVNDIRTTATKQDAESIDDWQTLTIILNRMATGIARRSRRGRGNWAIIPISLLPMLQENPNYLHFPETELHGLRMMGELLTCPESETGIKIYVDIVNEDNSILVGYKGDSDIDTGYVYSPYILAVPRGIETDPETFQMTQTFINRGDAYTNNPENYYTSMEVLS